MKFSYLDKNYRTILAVVAVVLLIVSIIFHELENFPIYRALRGIISFVFLGLMILLNGRNLNYNLVGFLFFYGASSIATVWYENNLVATLAMAFNFVAFLFLIRDVYPKVSFVKIDLLFGIFFLLVVLFNSYLLYEFTELLRVLTLSNAHYVFMILGSMAVVTVIYLTLLSNYQLSSNALFVFTLFAFSLVFCEIFRAIGYYNFAYGQASVYLARVLLICSSYFIVHFSVLETRNSLIS